MARERGSEGQEGRKAPRYGTQTRQGDEVGSARGTGGSRCPWRKKEAAGWSDGRAGGGYLMWRREAMLLLRSSPADEDSDARVEIEDEGYL